MIAIGLGIVLGVLSGLIPGVGKFILILMIWPLLGDFSVIELLMMYVSMSAISQYIGSLPAIVYGIPGEGSSYPAVVESKFLDTESKVSQAISGSAFGSMFGGIIVVIFCYLLADYADSLKYFFSTKILVFLLLFVVFVMIFTMGNSKLGNIVMIVTGLTLGLIGNNSYLGIDFLTFGSSHMWAGLPMPVVLICLFAIPQIAYYLDDSIESGKAKTYEITKVYFLNPLGLLGSSIVGFFGGLVPGLSAVFSSAFAYGLSTLFTKNPVKRIVVSETANNAGAFSQILPLLIFGVPIIGSEALLLFFMEQKGFSIHPFSFSDVIPTLALTLMFVNFIGFLLAWPFSKHVNLFYAIDTKKVMIILLICLIGVVVYTGYIKYSTLYYITVFLVLAPIGVMLRKVDTLPLVFAFQIHDKLLDGLYRFYQLL